MPLTQGKGLEAMVLKSRKGKRGYGRFALLPFALLDSDAFCSLKTPAVSILVGLLRRYNGHNNAHIPFSCREAAAFANVSPNTAARAFSQLEEVGIIKCITPSNFDCRKKLAREWALTFQPIEGAIATGEWRHFKIKTSVKTKTNSVKGNTNVLQFQHISAG